VEVWRIWRIVSSEENPLSNSQVYYNQQRFLEEWAGLEDRGVLLEPFEHRCGIYDQRRGIDLLIRQWGEWDSNRIFELSSGAFAYTLHAFIRSDGVRRAIIMDWQLELPWPDRVEWLEDPKEGQKNSAVYNFRGKDWLDYPRKEVLNHRLAGRIAQGDLREGLLLGKSCQPPPDTYQHGETIPAILKVFDQHDRPHLGTFELYLSRSPRPKNISRNRVRRNIFSDPDLYPRVSRGPLACVESV
jgi:hypothetical protein